MTRFLGAAWASVHGPSDVRRLAIWSLELGFGGLAPGPSPRAIDWTAMRAVISDLPFGFGGSWRLAPAGEVVGRADADLAVTRAGAVQSACASVRSAVEQAARIGLDRVVLEPGVVPIGQDAADLDLTDPGLDWVEDRVAALRAAFVAGRDQALDRVCRVLHRICRSFPEQRFALSLSGSAAGLGEPEALEAIFEDLAGCRLEYWHDTALGACRQDRLGQAQGDALERFASRISGVTIADWGDGQMLLPPGAGLVDFPLLASYLRGSAAGTPLAVELDPGVPPGEIPGVQSFLTKFGL